MDASQFDVKRLDHLGLVATFCKEIHLAEKIDAKLPKKSHLSKISNGQLLIAMLLNGLGFVSRTLHMYPEYFSDKPTERLLGPGIHPEHINDDVMGRFLDLLYEEGVSELYEDIALTVVRYLGLEPKSINIDTTSFHLDGDYETDSDAQAIKITRGYSRDHRPELNQVILNLITENQAGLPLYMQACSGNASDMDLFKKTVKSHVKSLKSAYNNTYFIGDAALYTEETIKSLAEQNQLFISRAPQKLKEVKAVLANASNADWIELSDGYSGAWFSSNYGDVSQRWLLVKSEKAKKRESHILDKSIYKATEKSLKSFNKSCRQKFSCESDASKALEQWQTSESMLVVVDSKISKIEKRTRRGRPSSKDEIDTSFKIEGHVATSLSAKKESENLKGLFVLATNDLNDSLDMQFILDEYKSQQAVERGFRFLKSPDFLTSSFFIKKPERIEALLMVMTCSLLVYAAMEHLIRRRLIETQKHFPDMKKKPSQNPTAKWVFFCFQGISIVQIDKKKQLVTNIVERQKVILDCLGSVFWEIYS